MKPNSLRRIAILVVGALVSLMIAIMGFSQSGSGWPFDAVGAAEEISISEAHDLLEAQVDGREASILDSYVYIRTPQVDASPQTEEMAADSAQVDPGSYDVVRARLPFPAHEMIRAMVEDAAVPLTIERNPGYEATFADRLLQFLPIFLLLAVVGIVFFRGFGRSLGLDSSFAIINPEDLNETFEDVAGIDTARSEIQELVEYLRDPAAVTRLGGYMPKGAIFTGSPGNGKTLLARAMAKEAGVPFIKVDASGVNQLFVGAGAMKIKKVFQEARKIAPCIVFIDEIDAMGRARGNSHSGAGDEKETTLNQLLVELDGFQSRDGVLLVAATNRKEILDKALTRRGRIDLEIHIDDPDIAGRTEILKTHARKSKLAPGLDLSAVARTTAGFSGADLAAFVNTATLIATRAGRDEVVLDDFMQARDKMLLPQSGAKRALSEKTKRTVAYHEAGHAVVAAALEDADPIEKATILPQGGALGYVLQSPSEDRHLHSRDELIARIRVAVAGRVAEELAFGPGAVTNGAASDIKAATGIAKAMITTFGMGSSGFVCIDPQDPVFLDTSGALAREVRTLIDVEMGHVREFLAANRDTLDKISALLLEEETIDGERITELVGKRGISFDANLRPAA